jgi:hypothetical protein
LKKGKKEEKRKRKEKMGRSYGRHLNMKRRREI